MYKSKKSALTKLMIAVLVLISLAPMANAVGQSSTATPASKEDLIGPLWQWDQWVETKPASLSVVPDPEKYTLSFSANNSVTIQADCNQVLGTYILRNGKLQIELGPSTLAYCGDQSLDQQFLALLGQVESAGMLGEQLQLSLGRNAGYLGLRPGNQVGIAPEQISLDTQGLPYSWQANVVPATPYDDSQPTGPTGLPEHIEINFGPSDPAARQPGDPIMYIIPVDAYRDLWLQAGNDYVAKSLEQIFGLTVALPAPAPLNDLPALPSEEFSAVNDLAVQLDRAASTDNSATKNGYRFVGRWVQSPNPVVNGNLRYVYQGFTNDGRYLVSFSYPVTTETLPDSAADVSAEEMQQVESDPAAYLAAKAPELNDLPPSAWTPDLNTLDALVGSLLIEGMPPNGLQGNEWRPFASIDSVGGSITPINDPTQYSVTYASDGTLSYVADCNSGAGTYTITGGMVGGIRTALGASTLAFCGADSYADALVATLASAQNYKLMTGGKRMELVRPAGGGSLYFELVGPAESEADPATPEPTALPPTPTPLPPVALPTAGPQVPTGRVIAPDGVNVRSGPGTQYPIIGFAPFGATAQIAGRSADRQWWAAVAPASPTGLGWVSASFVQATNAQNVPILPAPPLAPVPTPPPAQPAPTLTPTPTAPPPPAQATATPAPVIQFSANPTTIEQGKCTRLSWHVENVSSVWVYPLGDNYRDYPVAGVGSREECPQSTTTYEMRVLLNNGELELRQQTITVEAANPLRSTEWALASMNVNGVLIPGTTITLNFGDRSDVNGKAGCNNYSGTYTVNGSTLLIGGITSTQITCGEEIDQQEQFYLVTLQSTSSYELQGSQLVIRDLSGAEILRYNKD